MYGRKSTPAYGNMMTGDRYYHHLRQRRRVTCTEYGVDLEASTFVAHRNMQHGLSGRDAVPAAPLKTIAEYYLMAFLQTATKID